MSRRRRRRRERQATAAAALAGVALATAVHASAASTHPQPAAPAAPAGTVAAVIAYAREQIGCPYAWGSTGPCDSGYDCSGLVMEAYASAGVTINRTSQAQWSEGPQVTTPQPGDLVFFAGADGTWSAPGHVGLVVSPARHLMIDAYGPNGAPISYDTYGLPTSRPGLGPGTVVGFTDPLGGSS